jgi:hypothetical protein
MSDTNTGGPAFPNQVRITDEAFADLRGMTLRDYFAAKAMQGLTTTLDQTDEEPFWTVIATDSYKLADAMLRAREAT